MGSFKISLKTLENRLDTLAGQSAESIPHEFEVEILRHKREFVLQNLFRTDTYPLLYSGLSLPQDEEQMSFLRYCLLSQWFDVSIAPCGREKELVIVQVPFYGVRPEHFVRLKQLAAYFKLRFYPCLREEEIRFEEGRVCCDNLRQYAPISMTGMLGSGIMEKVGRECAEIRADHEYEAYLRLEEHRSEKSESANHQDLTAFLRRTLGHDSFKTAFEKMLKALFPDLGRELILSSLVQVIGEESYLGFGIPAEQGLKDGLYKELLDRGLVLSSAPYGKSMAELFIVQQRRGGGGSFQMRSFLPCQTLPTGTR